MGALAAENELRRDFALLPEARRMSVVARIITAEQPMEIHMTATANPILSREIKAGYDPALLANARILISGLGALAQNMLVNLALSQVGEIWAVDFDEFDLSNATRSPFYPSEKDVLLWGRSKATVVPQKLRQMIHWASLPRMRYFNGVIQALGDSPFEHASIVISAVDNALTRAYLSDMCRRHSVPLVEGGFTGSTISFAVFANRDGDPCWSCQSSGPVKGMIRSSCTATAAEVEAAGFLAATQSVASTLGGLMAEAAIQVLHGQSDLANRRLYLNIRTGAAAVAKLKANASCSGRHDVLTSRPALLSTTSEQPLSDLLAELRSRFGGHSIKLPSPYVVRIGCDQCGSLIEVKRPEGALTAPPKCQACGGLWPIVDAGQAWLIFNQVSSDDDALLAEPCAALGIAPGALVEACGESGEWQTAKVAGNSLDLFEMVSSSLQFQSLSPERSKNSTGS
jgi:molybdopterin/thiamine biosynthesis adenylyltransferase